MELLIIGKLVALTALLMVLLGLQVQIGAFGPKPALLRYGLHGRKYIQALVLAMVVCDRLRSVFRLNLGRFPMAWKLLYIRVLLHQFGSVGTAAHEDAVTMNRARRRSMYFSVPQRMRYAYYDWLMARRGIVGVAGGATIVKSRTGLFWTQNPGGLPVIQDVKMFSGNVFFVDSNTSQGGTSSGYGGHPDKAITDIESAYDLCTATQGDAIFVLPGHAETLADEITMDVAGVSVLGQGHGSARPTITQNFAGDGIAMDAINNVVDNLYFNEATTAPGAGGAAIDINANYCLVSNCWFDVGADDLEAITITATGDFAEVVGCAFNITANGPDAGIEIEAVVTELHLHHNRFLGGNDTNAWDVGGINSGSAHTQCVVEFNTFVYGPAIIFSAAATGTIQYNTMAEGTLGSMLDPGSCMCFENYEADAIDETARLFPTGVAT